VLKRFGLRSLELYIESNRAAWYERQNNMADMVCAKGRSARMRSRSKAYVRFFDVNLLVIDKRHSSWYNLVV
jgi:hypothetical protein